MDSIATPAAITDRPAVHYSSRLGSSAQPRRELFPEIEVAESSVDEGEDEDEGEEQEQEQQEADMQRLALIRSCTVPTADNRSVIIKLLKPVADSSGNMLTDETLCQVCLASLLHWFLSGPGGPAGGGGRRVIGSSVAMLKQTPVPVAGTSWQDNIRRYLIYIF